LLNKPVSTLINSAVHKLLKYGHLEIAHKVKIKTFWGKKIITILSAYSDLWRCGAYINDPEVRLTRFLIKNTKEKGVFFDIGANIGYYSLLVSNIASGVKIFSFEPDPFNIRLLISNKEANIDIIQKAVGRENGNADFYVSTKANSGISTLKLKNRDLLEKRNFKKMNVKLVTMDTFCKETRRVPNLIKIDVEGAEEDVLKGGSRTLKEADPTIIMEVWCTPFTENYRNALKILKKAGFKCFSIEEEGTLKERDYKKIEDYFKELQEKYISIRDSSNFDNLVFMKG
jgi:FkbM family methyltransferase